MSVRVLSVCVASACLVLAACSGDDAAEQADAPPASSEASSTELEAAADAVEASPDGVAKSNEVATATGTVRCDGGCVFIETGDPRPRRLTSSGYQTGQEPGGQEISLATYKGQTTFEYERKDDAWYYGVTEASIQAEGGGPL